MFGFNQKKETEQEEDNIQKGSSECYIESFRGGLGFKKSLSKHTEIRMTPDSCAGIIVEYCNRFNDEPDYNKDKQEFHIVCDFSFPSFKKLESMRFVGIPLKVYQTKTLIDALCEKHMCNELVNLLADLLIHFDKELPTELNTKDYRENLITRIGLQSPTLLEHFNKSDRQDIDL